MVKKQIETKPILAFSLTAARVSFATAVTFVVLLAALHFLKPELDPSWRFISEYAIGDYGWMMVLAFLSLAASYVALFITLRRQLPTTAGRIGLAMLLISALGLAMAGIFTTDPVTVSPEAATTNGMLHSLGGTLGIAMSFAAAIISWQLARNSAWAFARRPLLWTAGIALATTVAFIAITIMEFPSDGVIGPEVKIGWPGRIEIAAYCAWLLVVSRSALKLHT